MRQGLTPPMLILEDFPILPRKPGYHRNQWTAELSQQGGCAQEGWLRKPAALGGGEEKGTQNAQLLRRLPLSQSQSVSQGATSGPSVGRGAAATALLPVRRDRPTRPA